MRRSMFGLSALISITALVVACGGGSDCDSDSCAGAAGDDGGDGAVDPDANPSGCESTKEQKEQPACQNDDFAVYVTPTGTPDAKGTQDAPVNTITRALALIGGKRNRIFVCEGTYVERVTVDKAVSIYGGFSCAAKPWTAGARAVIGKLQEPGYALDIPMVAGAYELADLEFTAAAGTGAGASSVAARVVGSPGVVFKRVTLTAHQGAEGAPGDSGKTGDRTPADGKGITGTMGGGGAPKPCTCAVGGPTAGGSGGGPANGAGLAGSGDAVGTAPIDGLGGTGGVVSCSGGLGHEGASAPDQTPAVKADKFGAVVADDWVPGLGLDGKPGGSGQGGGGGGANMGGGGGGGCGGCGGTGGKGGKGGGASIGLLAIGSPVKLVGMTITIGPGGKGGKGGSGAQGGAPGFGGDAGSGGAGASGCAGGPGGRGGNGGHGSGGPGGVAVGVLYAGAAVVLDAASTVKQSGQPAAGGAPAASGANEGPVGQQLASADATKL